MVDLKQPSNDGIMHEIKGIFEIISGLRLGMVKRSVQDAFMTPENAMKDVDRHHYIDFLMRKTFDLYRIARGYGFTTVFKETALMRIDKHYVDMLERELKNTPRGFLYYAILKEIHRVDRRISLYPYAIL